MLKKDQRITDNRDFQRIYRRGRHFSSAFFNLNYTPNLTGKPRLGIVVSKKVAKKATERNLLKRRLREVARELYPSIQTDADIIVSTKPQAFKASFEPLNKDLKSIFVLAHLLKEDNHDKKTSA